MDLTHATPELFAALALAQGEIENASKNAANPHFRSKYADLAEVLNTLRPVFAKNGLTLLQAPSFDGSLASVTTLVSHAEGGYITAVASAVPAKTDAQGIGSVTTYLRRYSAAGMAGIAQEDDDGQSARHEGQPAPLKGGQPLSDVWERQSEESQAYLMKIAAGVLERMSDPVDAVDYLSTQSLDSDEKAALWTRLDSKTRAAIKKETDNRKEK